jgi:hypothetical protein
MKGEEAMEEMSDGDRRFLMEIVQAVTDYLLVVHAQYLLLLAQQDQLSVVSDASGELVKLCREAAYQTWVSILRLHGLDSTEELYEEEMSEFSGIPYFPPDKYIKAD